jgi:hypothetical protein
MQINRCPKCGREPSEIRLHGGSMTAREIECYDCGFHTGRCESHEEAVIKWNEMTKGMKK